MACDAFIEALSEICYDALACPLEKVCPDEIQPTLREKESQQEKGHLVEESAVVRLEYRIQEGPNTEWDGQPHKGCEHRQNDCHDEPRSIRPAESKHSPEGGDESNGGVIYTHWVSKIRPIRRV